MLRRLADADAFRSLLDKALQVQSTLITRRMTEVSAEGLEPGAQVITDQRMGKAAP